MAVQKNKKTRSKRGMRRAHNALARPTLSEDQETGETHRRHHLSRDGYYRGRKIIENPAAKTEAPEEPVDDN